MYLHDNNVYIAFILASLYKTKQSAVSLSVCMINTYLYIISTYLYNFVVHVQ